MVKPPDMTFSPSTVFAQLLGRLRHGDRDAVAHRPGVRVVTVETPEHAARRPRDDAYARAVHGGTGRERVQEPHVAGGERRAHVRLGNVLAEVDAELVRALRRERRLARDVVPSAMRRHPWKVRLMTSICCSRVSRTKLTA